jgi:rare lipoprotein A
MRPRAGDAFARTEPIRAHTPQAVRPVIHGGSRATAHVAAGRRAGGALTLHRRVHRPQSALARLVVPGAVRRLGRLNAYRFAHASWYGPGLYGNHLGCGGILTAGDVGVAHKSLPCGAPVTLRHGRRTIRVRVIDRGPYVAGREFDLTAATARRLGFRGYGPILTTH